MEMGRSCKWEHGTCMGKGVVPVVKGHWSVNWSCKWEQKALVMVLGRLGFKDKSSLGPWSEWAL